MKSEPKLPFARSMNLCFTAFLLQIKYKLRLFQQIAISIIVLNSFVACRQDKGPPDYSHNLPPHNTFFDTYLTTIESDFAKHGVTVNFTLPIAFGDLDSKTLGICTYADGDGRTNFPYIKINSSFQDQLQDGRLEKELSFTLKHELGHCYFKREHDVDIMLTPDGIEEVDPSQNLFGRPDVKGEIQTFIPKSMMYPLKMDIAIYESMKDYYDQELLGLKNAPENLLAIKSATPAGGGRVPSPNKLKHYVIKGEDGTILRSTSSEIEFREALYTSIPLISEDEIEGWRNP